MLCNQLENLQHKFAALLVASDQQEQIQRLYMVPADDEEAIKAFRQQLQQRLAAAATKLAAHVQEHGCAN